MDSKQDWESYLKVAHHAAAKYQTVLGAEDYAAEAVTKLFLQDPFPNNPNAWLRTVVRNKMIDRAKKVKARAGESYRGYEPEEIVALAKSAIQIDEPMAMSYLDNYREMLDSLSATDQKILIMSAEGYTTNEIAIFLEFKNGKTVATKLGQIRIKLKASFEPDGTKKPH
jgi:DNA-directed RNA polymerase specialized sigma24 family protein